MYYKFRIKPGQSIKSLTYEILAYLQDAKVEEDDHSFEQAAGLSVSSKDSDLQDEVVEFLRKKAQKGSLYAAEALGKFFDDLLDETKIERYHGLITGCCSWGWYYHAYLMGLERCLDEINSFAVEWDLKNLNSATGMPSDYNEAAFKKRNLLPKVYSELAKYARENYVGKIISLNNHMEEFLVGCVTDWNGKVYARCSPNNKSYETVYHLISKKENQYYFARCDTVPKEVALILSNTMSSSPSKEGGCYIATAVYGSYDCPPVWTLRRFRDEKLRKTFAGRLFIKIYYRLSPRLAKNLGKASFISRAVRGVLDKLVAYLNKHGVEYGPYMD